MSDPDSRFDCKIDRNFISRLEQVFTNLRRVLNISEMYKPGERGKISLRKH